jgi:hypothetical protein
MTREMLTNVGKCQKILQNEISFFLPSTSMPKAEYDFKDPRFLFLLGRVAVPPEVKTPHHTKIVLTPGLPTFGQFYRHKRMVSAWGSFPQRRD